jgi:hypothetical protein
VATVLRRAPSTSNVDLGKRMEESENVEDPKNHGNHDDTVQDRLDTPLHWDEAIHQPQQDSYHNQYFENLNQRHDLCHPSWANPQVGLEVLPEFPVRDKAVS